MSDPVAAGGGASALCERHRLRYDPRTQTGCVLCRREEAGASSVEPVAKGGAADDVRRGWAVAALLWLAAAGALFGVHRQIAAALAQWQYGAESALARPDLGLEPGELQPNADDLAAYRDDGTAADAELEGVDEGLEDEPDESFDDAEPEALD